MKPTFTDLNILIQASLEIESGFLLLGAEVSIWKCIKCFLVHTISKEFRKGGTITSHFGFVFGENWVREITWLSWRHRFPKRLS